MKSLIIFICSITQLFLTVFYGYYLFLQTDQHSITYVVYSFLSTITLVSFGIGFVFKFDINNYWIVPVLINFNHFSYFLINFIITTTKISIHLFAGGIISGSCLFLILVIALISKCL